ncbi:MAG: tetratricopeptide repeat protein [Chitinophagaceae bacterium]|nr:MAG: tetratricopeptide repeat protein [Chitinophagaceae bacterium]
MKKIALYGLLAVSILAAEPVLAQKSKVTTAVISMRNKDFAKAKEAINEASNNEVTKIDPKTWYYRGQIYNAIYADPKLRATDPNALNEALNSFVTGAKLDTKNKTPEIKEELQNMAFNFFNDGIKAYGAKDYPRAFEQFSYFTTAGDAMGTDKIKLDNALKLNNINPLDVKLYMASSAQETKNFDKAKQYYNELVTAKYDEPLVYMNLADLYQTNGDTASAIKVLDNGMANLTDKKGVLIEKLNIYIKRGQKEEALKLGKEALQLDPENVSLIIAMGNIYDNLKMSKEAQEMYDKALAKNPNDLNTNYSIGISYFNQGAEKYNQSNETRDVKKGNTLMAEAKENFKKSVVYLEKALAANPQDKGIMKDILGSLKEMYAKLDNAEKSMEYSAKLKALK